ncbi:mannosyltransferase [Coemansia sp. Benny D115]|nr:mannosyltransferase [Coemansia sp. Benny D115]
MQRRELTKRERIAEKRQAKQRRKQQEQIVKEKREQAKLPDTQPTESFLPSFGLLFRLFSLIRLVGALSSPIQDCDEVFNYWEPLHFLQFGTGRQTWEYAPQYGLRSYAYLWIHKVLLGVLHFVFGFHGKRQVFYALRLLLALGCAACEAWFVRAVGAGVDRWVAVVTAAGMAGMAGMFHAGVALLPTSFAMCLGMVGSAAAMQPVGTNGRNTAVAVAAFVLAATLGWPYALIAAVPFAIEQVVETSVPMAGAGYGLRQRAQVAGRLLVLGGALATAALGVMTVVDSHYYGKTVVAAWNQVAYNVLGRTVSGERVVGSELYGTEPWYFYLQNGVLNGGPLMLLAVCSLPLWALYHTVLRVTGRGKEPGSAAAKALVKLYSDHRKLLYRISPFWLVLMVFSSQPHKEERFLSIVYPQMCFAAAVALKLLQPLAVWLLTVLQTGGGNSFGRVHAVRRMLDLASVGALVVTLFFGVLRSTALARYYGAPMQVFSVLPELRTGQQGGADLPLLPLGPSLKSLWTAVAPTAQNQLPSPAASSLKTVCVGREWYRFPSSYWLPQGYELQFVATESFTGQLPGSYIPVAISGSTRNSTSSVRSDFNALNKWEPLHAIDPAQVTDVCDYYVAVDHTRANGRDGVKERNEMDGMVGWRAARCLPMLDAQGSTQLARVVYLPEQLLRVMALVFGESRVRQSWVDMCMFEKESVL